MQCCNMTLASPEKRAAISNSQCGQDLAPGGEERAGSNGQQRTPWVGVSTMQVTGDGHLAQGWVG